jgi:hypothetical protein
MPATNSPLLNGFFGPVTVLLRSEKEIVFVNPAELNLPLFSTNETLISITTNSVVTAVTSSAVTTNYGRMVPTNTITQLIYVTNTFNISRAILLNPVRLTAKQLRADLVDALVFAK